MGGARAKQYAVNQQAATHSKMQAAHQAQLTKGHQHYSLPCVLSSMSKQPLVRAHCIAYSVNNRGSTLLRSHTACDWRPCTGCTGTPAAPVCTAASWIELDCACFSYSGVAMRPGKPTLSGSILQKKRQGCTCFIRCTCPQLAMMQVCPSHSNTGC